MVILRSLDQLRAFRGFVLQASPSSVVAKGSMDVTSYFLVYHEEVAMIMFYKVPQHGRLVLRVALVGCGSHRARSQSGKLDPEPV